MFAKLAASAIRGSSDEDVARPVLEVGPAITVGEQFLVDLGLLWTLIIRSF